MSDPSYFSDTSTVLITGISGTNTDYGGKTILANWWAYTHGRASFDLVIFLNFQRKEAVRGTQVDSLEELADAMAEGESYFNVTPATADWEGFHARFEQFIAALDEDMRKFIVHDEAPTYDGEESLRKFVRLRGQMNSCKSVVVAQAPGDLEKPVRKASGPLAWVGPITTENQDYFSSKSYSNHFDHIMASQGPYEWCVITGPDDGDRDDYAPVPEEFARPP